MTVENSCLWSFHEARLSFILTAIWAPLISFSLSSSHARAWLGSLTELAPPWQGV